MKKILLLSLFASLCLSGTARACGMHTDPRGKQKMSSPKDSKKKGGSTGSKAKPSEVKK